MPDVVIAAFYHFVRLPDYAALREKLSSHCLANELRGTILLAPEGFNGTIAGCRQAIDSLVALLKSDGRFGEFEYKESFAETNPFHRMKVRLKKEIVTMGVPDTDPGEIVGTYLDANEWNALLDDEDVLVIDTRNQYEIQIGTFDRAVSPHTSSFREFPDYVKKELAGSRNRKVAMFCTGGIRCEKATSYLKSEGFENVYHLKGGILRYLETVTPDDNQWQGECFVFDNRVSVTRDLTPGSYDLCHACRRPITDSDKASPQYVAGVSCPGCIDECTDRQRQGFSERARQMRLATQRGERHIGVPQVKQQCPTKP